MHVLLNTSRSKDNQTMKFGQLIEFNVEIFFLKNDAENEVGILVPDLFLFFEKAFYEAKPNGLHLQ